MDLVVYSIYETKKVRTTLLVSPVLERWALTLRVFLEQRRVHFCRDRIKEEATLLKIYSPRLPFHVALPAPTSPFASQLMRRGCSTAEITKIATISLAPTLLIGVSINTSLQEQNLETPFLLSLSPSSRSKRRDANEVWKRTPL